MLTNHTSQTVTETDHPEHTATGTSPQAGLSLVSSGNSEKELFSENLLQNPSGPATSERPTVRPAAAFHYDKEVLAQCQQFLQERNYHGLALVARQKGIPPFLRFKVWPILLKHHPFVAAPFLQPDADKDKDKTPSADLGRRIRKDVRRYMRLAFSAADEPRSQTELHIFDAVERAVHKFVTKWGRIVRYDAALTWMALGLAEWVPPLANTPWVLLGRGAAAAGESFGSVFADYDGYIDAQPGIRPFLEDMVADTHVCSLQFHEVYERLALVMLHSPEGPARMDRSTLPTHGGTIEERVLFFIYLMQRLLPELSRYFQEELLLTRFGLADDEWLIWWLKYCGAKAWSRVDRGRVWDLMVGWRRGSRAADKLHVGEDVLVRLGPDAFWLVAGGAPLTKDDSFRDLMHDLHGGEGRREHGRRHTESERRHHVNTELKCAELLNSLLNSGNLLNPDHSLNAENLLTSEDLSDSLALLKCLDLLSPPPLLSQLDMLEMAAPHSSSRPRSPDLATLMKLLNVLAAQETLNIHTPLLLNHLHPEKLDSSGNSLPALLPATLASSTVARSVPFATLDPHMELLFVALALLKAKESTLVELDQHEIRTYLSRLPAKSYNVSDRYKQYQEQKDKGKGVHAPDYVFTYDYMDSIIAEAGELWRKWLWSEMNGES